MNLSKVTREWSAAGPARGRDSLKPGAACLAVIATAALIAGCGGSSSPSSSSTAKTKASKVTTKHSAGAGAPASKSAPKSTPKSAAVSSTASPTSFANTSNCEQLGGVDTKFAQAMAAATSGGKLNYQAAAKAYQQLANSAPSAIRGDVQLFAQAFTSFANAIAKAGYKPGKVPSPSQLAGLESAAKSFDSTKLAAAEKQLEAWAVKNCS